MAYFHFLSKLVPNILGFWVSCHVHLGVGTSRPSGFSTSLTITAETLVPAPTKSCCGSFAVTWGLLTTCLLRSLAAATASFLSLWCRQCSSCFELGNYASNSRSRKIHRLCSLPVSFLWFAQVNGLSQLFQPYFYQETPHKL